VSVLDVDPQGTALPLIDALGNAIAVAVILLMQMY
jgi:hypothetical protein